jgi:hypothetical protein
VRVGAAATFEPGDVRKVDGVEPGFFSDEHREFFVGKGSPFGAPGVLVLRRKEGAWTAALAKTCLPYVLTKEARERGIVPPVGESWLPSTMASAIPVALRYWEQPTPDLVKQTRDKLLDSGIVDERLVKLVDGDIRLCIERLFLYEPDDAPVTMSAPSLADALSRICSAVPEGASVVQPMTDAAGWEAEVTDAAKRADALLVLSDARPGGDPNDVVAAVVQADPVGYWLVEHDDTPASRLALKRLGPVFKLRAEGASSRVFVASFPPGDLSLVDWVEAEEAEPAPEPTTKAIGVLRLAKVAPPADANGEQRFVLGVVLEPEVVDAQKDVYSADEIRGTAHLYMERFGTIKLMHEGEPINDRVKILESYLAPCDFEIGEQKVTKGAWVMGVRVVDDALWGAVKKGELTGFSIGGSAVRKPVSATLLTRGHSCGHTSERTDGRHDDAERPRGSPPLRYARGGGLARRPRREQAKVPGREARGKDDGDWLRGPTESRRFVHGYAPGRSGFSRARRGSGSGGERHRERARLYG